MPTAPTPAQSETSRLNGARSTGPTTEAGKVRAALNGVRHGLTGQTFFLLPDEDPEELREHEATLLAAWRPRDLAEHDAASVAIRALWREMRADRLEAQILNDLFGADGIEDADERRAVKATAMKALARSCATGARSRASTTPPCASLTPCAIGGWRRRSPRDEANPSRRHAPRRRWCRTKPSACLTGISDGRWRRWSAGGRPDWADQPSRTPSSSRWVSSIAGSS